MNEFRIADVVSYVEENIGTFHSRRLESLKEKKLDDLLKRKNHYLFKAKNILRSDELVRNIYDAYLSSQEETLFGNFLEGLAIFVCNRVYGGEKLSEGCGIDLLFEKDSKCYIVEIKSGPHWGNSSQIKKMKQNFKELRKSLLEKNPLLNGEDIVAVNGCCYGTSKKDQDGYLKLCGQEFWEFISGNPFLYIDIIEPLGHEAKRKNEEFLKSYCQIINKFTLEFGQNYCVDGIINWEKLLKLTSERKKRGKKKG